MRCEVKLYVAGKVFTEDVHAVDYAEARQVALARNPNARVIGVNAIKNKQGYVTKDGMWAAIPSDGKKFAIVHNGQIVHFSRNYDSAMNYIRKELKRK